jgi:phospholipase C
MNRAAGAKKERLTRSQVPNLMALMDQYCVCDNYFSDFAGNSFPNHCFAIGGCRVGVREPELEVQGPDQGGGAARAARRRR